MNLKRSARVGFLVFTTTFTSTALATNGIFLIGYGAKSRSMGGVGIGYTQDGIGNQMNPAGITTVDVGESGWRLDFDAMLFRPIRSVVIPDPRDPPNAGAPIRYESQDNLFLIPAIAATYRYSPKLDLGVSFVGAGGGGTDYRRLSPLGFNFFNPVGREGVSDVLAVTYNQAQMAFTAAYKINEEHTVAVSPILGFQVFRAEGLGVFMPFSSDPDYLTGSGNDFAAGLGLRLGWQGKINEWLTLGAVVQSKIYFSRFHDYSGLFAEQGTLNSPANYGLGLAIKPIEKLTVAFDYQKVKYSDIPAIANPIEQLQSSDCFLGKDCGAGFGWKDQDIYKLGVKYQLNKAWDLSAGYNYGESPIPDDQLLFSAIAPAVTEKHFTLGAAYRPSVATEWSFAYVYAQNTTQSGLANSGGQFDQFYPNADLTGPGNMELQMYQYSLELTFGYKF